MADYGILGPVQQMASWQQPVGILGAALKDAGAYLSGHPADANSVMQYGQQIQQYQGRMAAQQAIQDAQSNDPAQRQRGYAAMVGLGLDPSGIQKMQAQSALPRLLQSMQPSMGFNDNPVAVTPAVNAIGPGAAAQRQAAQAVNAAPAMSMQPGLPLPQALAKSSPELQAELAPQLIQNAISMQSRQVLPATAEQKAAVGLSKDTPAQYEVGTGRVIPVTDPNAITPYQKEMLAGQRAERAEKARHDRFLEGGALGPDGLPNIDDPLVKSWVQNVTSGNATMQQVPSGLRNRVSLALQSTPSQSYSPLASSRYTMAANRIVGNFIKLPQYELTANGLPYLQRIEGALQHPGSVADQDLLDSLTKLNTAGNAVTDAQVRLITDGKSYADWAGTLANKFNNGGVLSDNQRQQVRDIANSIYENYRKGYQPVYDQATSQLKEAGIPEAFWTIPNLNKLNAGQSRINNGPGGGGKAPPQPVKKNRTVRFEDLP